MQKKHRLSALAALLAGSALFAAAPAFAQDDWHHPMPHAAPHPALGRPAPLRPGFGGRPAFHPLHTVIVQHRDFAHFSPAERTAWTHGRWSHRYWHGRWGWWWFAGGAWFWYDAPVYPYPTVVSSDYYEEPDYDNQGAPAMWYYCYNPAGYYPYVPYCYGPWRPVPGAAPQAYPGYGDEQGGPPPGAQQGPDDEQGPPPQQGYGPPPGQGGQDEGPPPGARDQGPTPGYDQGPPPGYDQGPPPGDDQGPPPNSER